MTRMRVRRLLVILTPLLAVVAALVAVRIALPPQANNQLAEALVEQAALNQFGPVVGTGLAAAAVIACAMLIPWTVIRALESKERTHDPK